MARSTEQIEQELAEITDVPVRVGLLNELVDGIFRSDPARALQLAQEGYALARSIADRKGEATSLRSVAACHESLSDYTAAMTAVRSAQGIYRKLNDPNGLANTLNTLGIIARGMTDYATALTAFNEAFDIFQRHSDQLRMAAIYNNIGTIHSAIGAYPDALEAYLASLEIYEKELEERNGAILMGNIAIIYYYLHDYDKSFEYHIRSLDVFRKDNNSYSTAISLGNLSSIYKLRGDLEGASGALSETLVIFQAMGEKRYEATTRIKLGMIDETRGDIKQGLEQFRRAAKLAESIGDLDTFGDAQHHIGRLYYRRRDFSKAIAALQKSLAVITGTTMLKDELDIRGSLVLVYESTNNVAALVENLKRCIELKDILFGEQRQRAVAEMQARFDVQHAEREREIFRLKSEHLEEMMEQRSKELTSMAMHLVQKNAFLERLRKDSMQIASKHPASKPAFDTLIRSIAENLNDADDWKRFEQEFQLVHPGFVQMISQRYPRLTPAELKVCAMLKINLSNKDITRLLSVSLRNVESHRYSIRKKIGLTSDINLSAYLAAL